MRARREGRTMDKRRQKRRHLLYYLEIFDVNADVLLGHIVDITNEGLMMVTKDPVETDVVFNLEMALPERTKGKEYVVFEARSIWCKPDVNPDLYGVGFQIVKVEDKEAEIIEGLTTSEWFQD